MEIPIDIHALQLDDPERAAEWRRSTRRAFTDALAGGWTVTGFRVDAEAGRGYYLLDPPAVEKT